MQRIPVYLYPNRITVISNLDESSANNTEWRIVYQRNVKIYKGIDNVIEIELKNNDQKRVEIGLGSLKLTLMDQHHNLINTYTAISLEDSTQVGLAKITIPSIDLEDLNPQFLKFAVTRVNAIFEESLTYSDSQFGALGTIELKPLIKTSTQTVTKYNRFTQETNYQGSRFEERKIYHYSEAVPIDTNRAVPVTTMTINAYVNDFLGEIYVQGTEQEVIGNEAFKTPKLLFQQFYSDPPQNGIISIPNLDVTDLTYIRVKYRVTSSGSFDYIKVIV